jgi:hypothetical protein
MTELLSFWTSSIVQYSRNGFIVFRIPDDEQDKKTTILSVLHHQQNPLESSKVLCMVRICFALLSNGKDIVWKCKEI